MKLPRESFLALAAVCWADGRMRKDEADGLRRAAEENGLDHESLTAVSEATADGVALGDVHLDALTPWQRALTFALASWLAKLDGVVNAEELQSLKALGDRLGLEPRKLQAASSAAFDVAVLPEGHRPDKYDFVALEERLQEKLPSTFRASLPPEG